MKIRLPALILIPILALQLTGCTATRELSMPDIESTAERPAVRVGQRVTVHLTAGDKLTGNVVVATVMAAMVAGSLNMPST